MRVANDDRLFILPWQAIRYIDEVALFCSRREGNSGEYTEAAAWQYRFYVPHEPRALAQLYGDDGEMCAYLTETMTGKSAVKGGSGPGQIYHNGKWGLHHEQVGKQMSDIIPTFYSFRS